MKLNKKPPSQYMAVSEGGVEESTFCIKPNPMGVFLNIIFFFGKENIFENQNQI